ncbi:acyl-CoA dehydrogenase family protein [Methylobacterium sp. 2A]|jgi:acyl-CoA dehydrogenase|uniref:acyl-CoA dehydrogenase family protein n=1 Tax=Methylobacterium sp. 2A TaxID=2603816 RepID=UPI00135550BB|nr:acyl-CoA dehydrogenase family protein [Methylobacterium sp. 2A]MWV24426.1 acyl-CoA dehydrogenase family protein [Methylobacterium sp. 2A]
MDFALTERQDAIRAAIPGLRSGFDDAYRTVRDRQAGSASVSPEAYGGSGLDLTEGAITPGAIAESGAGMSGTSAVQMNIFGLNPVIVFGAEEQKRRSARS